MATRIVDLGSVIGPQGPQGPAGAQGAAGAAGKSAYQYAVEGGYSGTETQFKAKLAKEYLPMSGGDMAGNVDMNNHFLTGLPSPVAPSDAVPYQTLINAIAGTATVVTVTVKGMDYYNNEVSKATVMLAERVSTAGSDAIFSISGSVTDLSGSIYDVTGVTVEFADNKFTRPTSDWSDLGGKGFLVVTNHQNALIGLSSGSTLLYKIDGDIHWGTMSEIVISGHVKVGVNA